MAKQKKITKRRKGKVADKWKLKTTYEIVAPSMFKEKVIAKTVADDEKKLLNRIFKFGLSNITGSYSELDLYSSVKMRAIEVKGKRVITKFIGHELSNSYLRTIATRRHSIIDSVVDIVTKDGTKLRVKGVIVSVFRISASQKQALRKLFKEEVTEFVQEKSLDEVMNIFLSGKGFVPEFVKKAKKIVPIRKVQIRKTEVPKTSIVVKKQ